MPTKYPASPKQVAFIEKLAVELGFEVATEDLSGKDASALIEGLLAKSKAAKLKGFAAKNAKAKVAMAESGVLPWKAGRYAVTGIVTVAKWSETKFGIVPKAMVTDDMGRKLWVTIPAKVIDSLNVGITSLKGAKVTLTATVCEPTDDPYFTSGKRPEDMTVTLTEVAEAAEAAKAEAILEENMARAAAAKAASVKFATDPKPCCSHEGRNAFGGTPDTHSAYGCNATIQVMSDMWDTCGCKNTATLYTEAKPEDGYLMSLAAAKFATVPEASKAPIMCSAA